MEKDEKTDGMISGVHVDPSQIIADETPLESHETFEKESDSTDDIKTRRIDFLKKARVIAIANRANGRPQTVTIDGETFKLKGMPEYKRTYYERLGKLGNSIMGAVRLKCYECSGYSYQEMKQCTCKDCALWVLLHNRKNKKETNGKEEREKLG